MLLGHAVMNNLQFSHFSISMGGSGHNQPPPCAAQNPDNRYAPPPQVTVRTARPVDLIWCRRFLRNINLRKLHWITEIGIIYAKLD